MKRTLILSATLILTVAGSNLILQAAPHYAVIHLGNLGRALSTARGINEAGEVVGNSSRLGNPHAFRWINGEIIDLDPDLAGESQAFGNNDLGQIVGFAGFEGQIIVGRAFLWENGEMLDLGTLGGEHSEANAINDLGQVVGFSNFELASGRSRAFLWQDGVMTQLGPSCAECSGIAFDINRAGQAVGAASTTDFSGHPVIWETDGTMTELPRIGADGVAFGMNDRGQIVGLSNSHAVLWENGEIIDLTPGNFFGSAARNINNHGISVGVNFEGRDHGTLWDTNRKQRNLNFMLAPLNKWWITSAFDINDSNQIAVKMKHRETGGVVFSAALLTPVNPTFKLFDPKPGIAGAINTITARGGNLEPGSVVNFYWGVRGGGTRITDCNMLDAVLQIENARPAGSAIADADGIATLEGFLPNEASGKNILFQAVTGPNTPTGCAQSQVIVVRID